VPVCVFDRDEEAGKDHRRVQFQSTGKENSGILRARTSGTMPPDFWASVFTGFERECLQI
jgi:hypothetical protein